MKRGDRFMAGRLVIQVTRVARDASWADIVVVAPSGESWTKRQPTPGGRFSFAVDELPGADQ